MQGDPQVIDSLNDLLAGELSSVHQYFIHSRMYENWGFSKLFERIDHEMKDELMHSEWLIQRILFLEGVPNLHQIKPMMIGSEVSEMLQNDLKLEIQVVADLKKAIKICEDKNDYVTRETLEKMLVDTEEDHAHWLEQQLGLIQKIGLQNYLQSQI